MYVCVLVAKSAIIYDIGKTFFDVYVERVTLKNSSPNYTPQATSGTLAWTEVTVLKGSLSPSCPISPKPCVVHLCLPENLGTNLVGHNSELVG